MTGAVDEITRINESEVKSWVAAPRMSRAANSQEGGFIDARRGKVHLVYDPTLPKFLGSLVAA
jgi:hypothetical protein